MITKKATTLADNERRVKKPYTKATLITYGNVRVFTLTGLSGVLEGSSSQSGQKKA